MIAGQLPGHAQVGLVPVAEVGAVQLVPLRLPLVVVVLAHTVPETRLLAGASLLVQLLRQGVGGPQGLLDLVGIDRGAPLELEHIDFGPQAPGGTSDPRALTIASTGNLPLTVSSVTEPEAPFTVSGGDCPLAPFDLPAGDSCTVQLRFVPVDTAPEIGLVEVGAEIEAPLFAVELWGNVTRPLAAFDPGGVDFGDLPVGGAASNAAVVLSNDGDFELDVDALTVTGPAASDFVIVPAQDSCSGTSVQPANSCGFTIRFQPTEPGVRKAALRLDSNEPDGPRTVDLLGTSDVVFFGGFE